VPFRRTHEIATRLVAEASRRAGEPLNRILAEISAEVLGSAVGYSSEELAEILSPQHFVRVRTTPGGPAPSETARAHAVSSKRLTADTAWLDDTIAALRAADEQLTAAAAAL
jgi:argininosuccinate lyase